MDTVDNTMDTIDNDMDTIDDDKSTYFGQRLQQCKWMYVHFLILNLFCTMYTG